MISDEFNYEEILHRDLLNPVAVSLYESGINAMRCKNFESALKYFNDAIALEDKFYNAYYQKFHTLMQIDNQDYCKEIEALRCIDKSIEYGPKSTYPHLKKGYYLKSLKKFYKAIDAFERGLKVCHYEILLILEIARCYKLVGDYNNAIRYYELSLLEVDEYNSSVEKVAYRLLGVGRVFSKTKFSTVFSKISSKPQYSTFSADIYAEYSGFMEELGFKAKSYLLIRKAIEQSRWDDYIEQRIKLVLSYPEYNKYSVFRNSLSNDSMRRKKLGGQLWENKNLYLYNCMKEIIESNSDEVSIDLIKYLFNDCPLSIIQVCSLKNKIHELSINKVLDTDLISNIIGFMDYLSLISITYEKRENVFLEALIHYYLGGIASSFIIFDDILDTRFSELSSIESYFYSRVSKEMRLDFLQINTFNINKFSVLTKTDEDFFFLGLMYLLNEQIEEAMNCFNKSSSYRYSKLMLSMTDEMKFQDELSAFDYFLDQKYVDTSRGIDQFIDYFILRECHTFISSFLNSEFISEKITIPKPLWETFIFDKNIIKNVSSEILRLNLIEKIKIELSNLTYDNNHILLEKCLGSIGFNTESKISVQEISNYICKSYLSQDDTICLTVCLYKNCLISTDEFINLNLYIQYLSHSKSKQILSRTLIFAGCAATSYLNTLLGIVFSTLFYYLDNSIFNADKHMSYLDFIEYVSGSKCESNKLYITLIKKIKQYLNNG